MLDLYQQLLTKHGPQGWWPIKQSYHPRDFSYPHTPSEQFEISVGAILTQNTNWHNVELALTNLTKQHLLSPQAIIKQDPLTIKDAIRPAGYFNQKYKKLVIFAQFFIQQVGIPTREQLLELWGIGPETADSILLYAYKYPTFVVDAYTKRVLHHYQLLDSKKIDYHQLQQMIVQHLPRDFKLYQEYHALLVTEAKELVGKT